MEKPRPRLFTIAIPMVIAIIGLFLNLSIAQRLQTGELPLWDVSSDSLLNFTFTMQIMILPVSLIALAIMYLYNKESFRKFFRPGTTNADWRFSGMVIAVAFTMGTAMMMSFSVSSQNGQINQKFFSLLPLVLLFSATNAWSEEILSRFVIIAGLDGKLQPVAICWISASIFGLAHISGTPSGLFGVLASGLLGWLLAKSVIETKGLGWALFIHFLQDVVIFGAGAMVLAGKTA